jgi:hypothetical protein
MSECEIRRTAVAPDTTVITIKLDGERAAHVVRPFQTFVVKRSVVGHRAHFVSEAAALQHHGALVAAYERGGTER